VDVSETILQARHFRSQQPTPRQLRQMRPGTIIDAAESFYRPTHAHIIGFGAIESVISRAMTGAARVVLVDADVVTSAVQSVRIGDHNVDPWVQWAEITKTALQRRPATDAKPAPSAAAHLRVKRLAAIQAELGLSTQDFAQTLGISRPGLYKWLDVSKHVKLQEASRQRLAAVERIAKQWRERSMASLGSVAHEPLAGGRTALALMAAENVDEAAVVGAFDELAAKIQGKPRSRSQKLAHAGYTRRPSARALPSDE
jgi:DNA-binding transcriptional regulator YiaG